MTTISEGIHPDIIRINRIRVRNKLSSVMCHAFLEESARTGLTLKDMADRLDMTEEVLIKRFSDAGIPVSGRFGNSLADITLAMGVDFEIKLIDRIDRQQTSDLDYDGAMSDLDAVLDVLIARINGESDLQSAAEWIRMNYPEKAKAIKSDQV